MYLPSCPESCESWSLSGDFPELHTMLLSYTVVLYGALFVKAHAIRLLWTCICLGLNPFKSFVIRPQRSNHLLRSRIPIIPFCLASAIALLRTLAYISIYTVSPRWCSSGEVEFPAAIDVTSCQDLHPVSPQDFAAAPLYRSHMNACRRKVFSFRR
ncbi:hypothetical protein C8Q79DRAFT_553400 [Trametes meyenii]|nr:hypothetical protein C8Q79DRAFT_553400 [Trametes meyenii]